MTENINIFLFKSEGLTENFGECLCKKVIHEMGFSLDNYSNVRRLPGYPQVKEVMTGIGGCLNTNIYELYIGDHIEKWYVWGSGLDCALRPHLKLPKKILDKCIITMLRGPETKEFYNIEGDILLADPGYLASYFFKFPPEEKKNVFVQFYYDKEVNRKINGVDVYLSSLLQPDVDKSFFSVLKNISNANIVLTGSMHIAIATHSYGVPFAIVSKEGRDSATEHKWYDTLLNIGLEKKDIWLCNSVQEGWEWWNSIKDKIRPITKEYQEQIIRAFPFEKE